MARAPKAENYALEFDESGAIAVPAMGEVYASGLAEDLGEREAWTQAGGAQSEKSLALKHKMDADPDFQSRVETLRAVRLEQLKDPHFGEAIAFINLTYRDARAGRRKEEVVEMVKLRLRAAESASAFQLNMKRLELQANPPERAPEEAQTKRPVGKPPSDSPQSDVNRGDMRQRLLDKGLKTQPIPPEQDLH